MYIVPHPVGPNIAGSPLAILVATLFGAWSFQPTAPVCPAALACPSCPVITTPACPAAVACDLCAAVAEPASGGWWSVASDPWFWVSWIAGTIGVQRLWNVVVARLKTWFRAVLPNGVRIPLESVPEPRRVRPRRAALQDGQREGVGLGLGPVLRRPNAVAPAAGHRPRG